MHFLITLFIFLFSPALWAQAETDLPDPYFTERSEISRDIYLVTRPDSTRQPVMSNGVFIINDDHVLVFDGAGAPLHADRLIAHIRAVTDKPVRYFVISNWHGDNNLGVHRLKETWPEMQILGHEFTAAAMNGKQKRYFKRSSDTIDSHLANLEHLMQERRLPDGSMIPPYLMTSYRDMVANKKLIIAQTKSSAITPPDRTFTDRLLLNDGGRRIELLFLDRANTAGDVIAWLPEEKIFLAGDVIVHPTPYGFSGFPRSWVGVLEEIKEFDAQKIVPGHGPVLTDTSYIDQLIELFGSVADQAATAVAADVNRGDFLHQLNIEAFRDGFTDGDPWLDSRLDAWFKAPISSAAWKEAAGQEIETL